MLFIDTRPISSAAGSVSRYLSNLWTKKRELVKLEIDFIYQIRSQWESISSNNYTDRVKAEATIRACYEYVGLEPPTILWAQHPIEMLKIFTNRLDFENVSGMIIDRIWNSSELEIQQTISPDSTALVLQHMHDNSPRLPASGWTENWLDRGMTIDQINSLADRLNSIIFEQITNLYTELSPDSLPSPLQDYRIADLSYLHYFATIGVNIPQVQLLVDLATSCGWCWTFKKIAILTPKPDLVKVAAGGAVEAIIYDDCDLLSI
jgi:hypothetical protein